jgi:hypothetical protein
MARENLRGGGKGAYFISIQDVVDRLNPPRKEEVDR